MSIAPAQEPVSIPVYDLVYSHRGTTSLEPILEVLSPVSHVLEPRDIHRLLMACPGRWKTPYEVAGIVMMDPRGRIVGMSRIGMGCRGGVHIYPESILERTFHRPDCVQVAVGHSHLVHPEPSRRDHATFREVNVALGAYLYLYDFYIIAPEGFYSFREHGHYGELEAADLVA